MNLYAYCLQGASVPVALEGVVGIAGVEAQVIEHEGFVVVVSAFHGEKVPLTRDTVFAHEGVIDHVLAQTTLLPFRFGTIVTRARLESHIRSQKNVLSASLSRVQDCVEMSVKVIWDGDEIRGREIAAVEKQSSHAQEATNKAMGPGAAFLAAKRREILGDEMLKRRADGIAVWLNGRLGNAIKESVVRVQPAEALVIAASYLVKREGLPQYRACLELAQAERRDLRFMTSGPWPPYSFSDLLS